MVNQGGKRHFELLVSVIVISIISLVFYIWVERLAVKVEQSRIQYMLSNIRSVIKIRELGALVSGRADELVEHHYGNPMDFFDTLPPEYAGELDENSKMQTGSWYFDRRAGELVYPVISTDSNPGKLKQLRYRLQYVEIPGGSIGRLHLVESPYESKGS